MKTVANSSVSNTDLLKPSEKELQHYIQKAYEDDPNRPFTIRMSNIGQPLCQLQMAKNKAQKVDDDVNHPFRMMYGAIVESLAVSTLKHAGINVQEEQTPVKLSIGGISISGTLDLVIDGKVWDVKSCSPYSYKEKFASYETLKADDTFGYRSQVFGYAKARGISPGGFVVIDKSSGEIKVIAMPENYQNDEAECLKTIENNVKVLASSSEISTFDRCFTDKEEVFKKRYTGNRVLDSTCSFCKFKYSCWPDLKFLPVPHSTAFDKPYKYYTVYNENTIS